MNKTLRYQQGTFEIPQLETVPESVHQSVLGALETIQKKEEKAVSMEMPICPGVFSFRWQQPWYL